MALIFHGVLVVSPFQVSTVGVTASQIASTSSLMMIGPNSPTSIHWKGNGTNAGVLTQAATEAKNSFRD